MAANYCGSWSAIAISSALSDDSGRAYKLLIRTRCKSWRCEYCAQKNRKYWTRRMVEGVQAVSDTSTRAFFITITAASNTRGVAASYKALSVAWRRLTEFWRKIHRRMGLRTPEYIRVFEAHRDGTLHLHAIWVSQLPPSTVYVTAYHRMSKSACMAGDKDKGGLTAGQWRAKDLLKHWGAGHQVRIEQLKTDAAPFVVSYIAKYLSKAGQAADMPRGARRILSSRGIGIGDEDESDALSWDVHRGGIGYDETEAALQGVDYLLDTGEDEKINKPVSIWSPDFIQFTSRD